MTRLKYVSKPDEIIGHDSEQSRIDPNVACVGVRKTGFGEPTSKDGQFPVVENDTRFHE